MSAFMNWLLKSVLRVLVFGVIGAIVGPFVLSGCCFYPLQNWSEVAVGAILGAVFGFAAGAIYSLYLASGKVEAACDWVTGSARELGGKLSRGWDWLVRD